MARKLKGGAAIPVYVTGTERGVQGGAAIPVVSAGSDITSFPGVFRIGDVVNGNYTEFEVDGTMVAVGDAICWKDINIDPIVGRGASAPDLASLDTTSIQVVVFDGVNTLEQVSNTQELQHDYVEGTDLKFHVHWGPTTAAAGNVQWFAEYYIYGDGSVKATGTINVIDAAPGTAWVDQFVQIGTISDNGFEIGDQISVRFYRNPSGGSDTYGADAYVKTIGIHYQVNMLGSRTEAAK